MPCHFAVSATKLKR